MQAGFLILPGYSVWRNAANNPLVLPAISDLIRHP